MLGAIIDGSTPCRGCFTLPCPCRLDGRSRLPRTPRRTSIPPATQAPCSKSPSRAVGSDSSSTRVLVRIRPAHSPLWRSASAVGCTLQAWRVDAAPARVLERFEPDQTAWQARPGCLIRAAAAQATQDGCNNIRFHATRTGGRRRHDGTGLLPASIRHSPTHPPSAEGDRQLEVPARRQVSGARAAAGPESTRSGGPAGPDGREGPGPCQNGPRPWKASARLPASAGRRRPAAPTVRPLGVLLVPGTSPESRHQGS